ncbi:sugar nucleotide-binding protein [Neobacillus sp. CF12]|uniref:sugar nucleotide-binding protein n=1 Tax=Neobacillus sp. CF12 TaxID=3055864 RepID=UPI0025A0F7B9|nr:sugar nucleotide-binding protein [Neobacillus sp. CF12]MDM5329026.1 sugar nucleotide-binding protein [Neobacillus sp. CF12]
MKKILILGGSGLVGRSLINELRDGYEVYGTYSSKIITNLPDDKQFQLDVQEISKMMELISSIQPDSIISCIRGEFGQQLKFHKELAKVVRNSNSNLYYFSTTNVFDGDFSKPHTETYIPIAESEYGNFKIDCENILKEILDEKVQIIRIPAIWGKDSPRWNSIKESIRNSKEIEVYSNLECTNLLDVQLARQLRFIIENNLKGIFHLGSVDTMTQSQFYEKLLIHLDSKSSLLKYNFYLDSSNTYYFALKSTRDDMPKDLQTTNEEIISYLLG